MSGIYSECGSNIPPPPEIIEDLNAGMKWDIGFATDSRIPMKKPCSIHQAEA